VNLEYVLREIDTHRGNLHGGRLLSLWRFFIDDTLWHIDADEQGASTPSVRRLHYV
jgi:hypothetical protein